jgi:hypothetical protein
MDKAGVRRSTIWMGTLLPLIVLFAAACGGGGTPIPTPPPPAISVSVSSASSIVQANATMQFHASVKNSPTQDVTWAITHGVNPLDGTNYLDTVSAFCQKAFLHLLAGEGVWGRGRHLSPFPQ